MKLIFLLLSLDVFSKVYYYKPIAGLFVCNVEYNESGHPKVRTVSTSCNEGVIRQRLHSILGYDNIELIKIEE